MRNVLVIINLASSARNFIGDQFSYLREKGYNMHLICSGDSTLKDFAEKQQIEYEAVPLNRQLSLVSDVKALIRICQFIRSHHIDTIIAHQVKSRLLGVTAARIMGVKHIIIFAHGAVFETMKGLKKRLLLLESKYEVLMSHKTICVSNYIKQLRLRFKIEKEKRQIILGAGTCNGIDTQSLFNPQKVSKKKKIEAMRKMGIEDNDFVIGFVGRLVRDKGVIELLEAFSILQRHSGSRNIKLMIVGAPEKRDGLPQRILTMLQKNQGILYVGKVRYEEMPLIYSLMSILVLPSHREGFGMCNIEAQAMGVPVLTTSYTGCVDSIIDKQTGFYISNDPEDIARKMGIFFDDDLRTKMGNNGREWVCDNFDHSLIWPYIASVLESIS